MTQFANLIGYSDITPFEIVNRISEKTIEIREMKATRDESAKLQFVAGGFSGHVVNQEKQKWIIKTDPSNKIIKARLRKDGKFYSVFGKHKISDVARKFYDYNF